MTSISYNLGCRNCLQSDGIQHSYLIRSDEQNLFQRKTEFEVMKLIEQWRSEDNHKCEFCGSYNVEVLQIEAGGHKLYDYNRITQRCEQRGEEMFQINIDKRGSDISFTAGGSEFIDPDLLKAAIQTITKVIDERPIEQFQANQKGNFFACLTGAISFPQLKPYLRIETFRSVGITKDEVIKAIRPTAEKIGLVL